MKIITKPYRYGTGEPTTLQAFAEKQGLTLEVVERSPGRVAGSGKFYAVFVGAEVKQGIMLCSESGEADSPEDAIFDYARRIAGRTLVLNAYDKVRRTAIVVPPLSDYHPTAQELDALRSLCISDPTLYPQEG